MDIFDAVGDGDFEFVQDYIDNNGDINVRTSYKKESLLHYMISMVKKDHQLKMMKLLLDNGVNPNLKSNEGRTALHEIIAQERLDLFLLLSGNKNLNVNIADNWGYTPLHSAIHEKDKKKYLEMVKTLINIGANINTLNNNKDTPLSDAIWEGRVELVELLLKSGGDLSVGKEVVINSIYRSLKYNKENQTYWNYLLQKVMGLKIKR